MISKDEIIRPFNPLNQRQLSIYMKSLSLQLRRNVQ